MAAFNELMARKAKQEYEQLQNEYFELIDELDNWRYNYEEMLKDSVYQKKSWKVMRKLNVSTREKRLRVLRNELQYLDLIINPPHKFKSNEHN